VRHHEVEEWMSGISGSVKTAGYIAMALSLLLPVCSQADWTVMDNDTAGFTSANLTLYPGASPYGGYNDTQRHSGPTATTNTWAKWTFTSLPNGDYDVAVCHPRYAEPSGANWTGYNRFLITDGMDGFAWSTSVRFPYYTNELVIADSTAVPKPFAILNNGPFRVTNGTLQVRLLWHTNNSSVVADAVAIRPAAHRTVFHSDDVSGAVSYNMPGLYTGLSGSLAGTKRTTDGTVDATNQYCRWVFAGVTPGKYKLWTTWVSGPNLTTNAVHSIYSGIGGPLLGAQSINQEVAPLNHTQDWGVVWQQLTNGADAAGTYRVTGTVFYVQVQGVANAAGYDYTAADAIRAELVESARSRSGTLLMIL
jgi:hypothetical protein